MDQQPATDTIQPLHTLLNEAAATVRAHHERHSSGAPLRRNAEARAAFEAAYETSIKRLDAVQSLTGLLGTRYAFNCVGLDSYEIYHEAQKPIVERLTRLVPTLDKLVQAGRGLVFYGLVGTGKDYLMASMLYEAAGRYGIDCAWASGPDIYERSSGDTHSCMSRALKVTSWPTASVMGISDPAPPAGDLPAWNLAKLGDLIDRRYRAGKSTWVTLNAKSIEEAYKKLSDPVFDRLQEGAEIFPCFWPSFRERKRGA
jgi:hypothetical protein